MAELEKRTDEGAIEQNEDIGPGWFLMTTYVVITVGCLWYLFSNWTWQSGYDKQIATIEQEVKAAGMVYNKPF
jgi:hypothetical protein